MANSSGDDNDEEKEDELDGVFEMFNDDHVNPSPTSNPQPTLERRVSSVIIDLQGTHCQMFNDNVNFTSTCNLQSGWEPGDTHCCSGVMSCWKGLKRNCLDMVEIYKKYYLIIRMAVTSLIICSSDMVLDVWTSVAHFERCDWFWGTATAILVILPLSWIAYTLIKREMWNHNDFKGKKMKVFLVVCAILQVLVIYWFIWKARKWWSLIKEKKGNKQRLQKDLLNKDILLFKKVKAKEGLLEGGLQLSLQSYILLKKIKNFIIIGGCPDNCNNKEITYANSTNSFSSETCIDYIQIGSIILSLFALAYSQAFMYQRHKMWRQLSRFFVYIQIISVRMFIPAVLAVFDNKCKWYLAPAASLICYSILYYTRRYLTKKGYTLPKFLQMTPHVGRETVMSRGLLDVIYWGLNHMLFNVTSVSGLAISIPYMLCTLPYVIIQDEQMFSMYFYYAAAGLSIICVIVNIVFVNCFRDFGKKIIPLSCDI